MSFVNIVFLVVIQCLVSRGLHEEKNNIMDEKFIEQQSMSSVSNETKGLSQDDDSKYGERPNPTYPKKCAFESEDLIKETQASSENASELSRRSDVVNKSLLRSIRRYYLLKFRKQNKDLMRKRLTNVKMNKILNALKLICEEEFEQNKISVGFEELARFMLVFLNLKPRRYYGYDKNIINKAGQVQDCMRKYSYIKFQNLNSIEELKIMTLKIKESYIDDFFLKMKINKQNEEVYKQAMDAFVNNFI